MKQALLYFAVILISVSMIPIGALGYNQHKSSENHFTVLDLGTNELLSISQKEFLIGALFAQIDANYNIEALKAQAVVAYTNAVFEKEHNTGKSYDFEVNISQEMIYTDRETAKKKYKEDYDDVYLKVEKAVDSVIGKKIVYNSKTALVPYFNLSSGMTEDAYTVWGQDVEYLKPVVSEGDLLCPNFKTTYSFSVEYIRNIIKNKYNIYLADEAAVFFAVNGRTSGGTVVSCNIGSLTMTGQDFRSLLGLCSANFDISCDGNNLTVICYGKGHFVGMSQYGADFMARQGKSYSEILTHYYTGVDIVG